MSNDNDILLPPPPKKDIQSDGVNLLPPPPAKKKISGGTGIGSETKAEDGASGVPFIAPDQATQGTAAVPVQDQAAAYQINGQPVEKAAISKELLTNTPEFIRGLQSGKINISVTNDPALENMIAEAATAKPKKEQTDHYLMDALERGWAQGEMAGLITPTGGVGDPAQIAEAQRKIQENRPRELYQQLGQAKGPKEWFNTFAKDPLGLSAELITESTASLVRHGSTVIPQRATEGGLAGGIAGTALPGIGTVAGFAAGTSTGVAFGMGQASLNLEYSGKIIESIQSAGYDVTDPSQLESAFSDDEAMAEIKKKALLKGVPVALFDAFSAGIAGRLFKEPAKKVGGKVVQWGTELLAQGSLGAGGEVAGQVASGEDLSFGAAANEFIGEVAFSPIEIASNVVLDKVKSGQVTNQDFVQAQKVAKAMGGVEQIKAQTDLAARLGEIDEDSKQFIDAELDNAAAADAKVPEDVPNRDEIVEKIGEKQKLEEQKKSVDKVFHGEINDKVKAIEEDILEMMKVDEGISGLADEKKAVTPKTETDEKAEEAKAEVLTEETPSAETTPASAEPIKGEAAVSGTVIPDAVGEKAKPIRQLGTGSNVYFETDKYRVNDSKGGKVYLNVSDNTGMQVPALNVEFDDVNEAVKVAEILEKEYPEGIPPERATKKYIETLRKEGNIHEQSRMENDRNAKADLPKPDKSKSVKLSKEEEKENRHRIISEYLTAKEQGEVLPAKQQVIAENITKIRQGDFERFGDENLIAGGLARQWFNNKALPLDVIAQEMSTPGMEITPQDIIEFVQEYTSGVGGKNSVSEKTFYGKWNMKQKGRDLETEYESLTGNKLDEKEVQQYWNEVEAEQAGMETPEGNLVDFVPEEKQDEITNIKEIIAKYTDENGITDWEKMDADRKDFPPNENFVNLAQDAEKQLRKQIKEGLSRPKPAAAKSEGRDIPAEKITERKAKTAGEVKAEQEYDQKLSELDTQIADAKKAKQKKLDSFNRRSEFFGGEKKADQLLNIEQDLSPANIKAQLKPQTEKIAKLEKERDDFIANKEKFLRKYEGQMEIPSITAEEALSENPALSLEGFAKLVGKPKEEARAEWEAAWDKQAEKDKWVKKQKAQEKQFEVDEKVIFTAKDGKQYEVNFRGYKGSDKAVIVGKPSDRIDQMEVDISQLSKPDTSDEKATGEPTKPGSQSQSGQVTFTHLGTKKTGTLTEDGKVKGDDGKIYVVGEKMGQANKLEQITNALDKLKIDPKGKLLAMPFPPQIWNGFIDAVKAGVKAGFALADAIEKGVEWLKSKGYSQTEADKYADYLDKETGAGLKQRKFAKRLLDDPNVDQDVKDALTNDKYVPISNKITIDEATAIIAGRNTDAAIGMVKNKNNALSPRVRVTMAEALIAKLNKEGEFDKAADVANFIVEFGTELGQGVQAFAIWAKLDPQSIINDIEAHRKKNNAPPLTAPQTQAILDLKAKVDAAPEGFQKNRALQELLNYEANLKGMSMNDLIMSVWYAHILSGYSTQQLNATANSGEVMGEIWTAAVYNPKALPFLLKGLYDGLGRGFWEAASTMKTGYTPITASKISELNILERFKGFKFAGEAWNPLRFHKYVGRFMQATDAFFYHGQKEMRAHELAFREAMKEGKVTPDKSIWTRVTEKLYNTKDRLADAKQQAKDEGLKGIDYMRRVYEIVEQNRPQEMTEDTNDFAAHGTFNYQPEGFMGWLSAKMGEMGEKEVVVDGFKPIKFIVPFTRIVANVANRYMDWSPIGYYRGIKGGIGTRTALSDLKPGEKKGQARKYTPEERAKEFIKATSGTIAMMTLYAMSQDDEDEDRQWFEVTASGTGDFRKNYELKETGWQPYSIRIGNQWINYQNTPLSIPMSIIGNLRDEQKYHGKGLEDETVMRKLTLSLWFSMEVIKDMSFLRGTFDFVSGMNKKDPEGAADSAIRFMQQAGKGFIVPNIYTQTSREIQRIWDMPMKEANNFYEQVVRDVPIARDSQNDLINALGDPVIPDTDRFSGKAEFDPIWDLIVKNNAWIGRVSKGSVIIQDGDIERGVTDDEYFKFSKRRGELIKEKITENLQELNKMSKAEVRDEIQSYKREATSEAKDELFK